MNKVLIIIITIIIIIISFYYYFYIIAGIPRLGSVGGGADSTSSENVFEDVRIKTNKYQDEQGVKVVKLHTQRLCHCF